MGALNIKSKRREMQSSSGEKEHQPEKIPILQRVRNWMIQAAGKMIVGGGRWLLNQKWFFRLVEWRADKKNVQLLEQAFNRLEQENE